MIIGIDVPKDYWEALSNLNKRDLKNKAIEKSTCLQTCTKCKGHGSYPAASVFQCDECEGSGVLEKTTFKPDIADVVIYRPFKTYNTQYPTQDD